MLVPMVATNLSSNVLIDASVGKNPNLCSLISCKKMKKKNIVVPVVAIVVLLIILIIASAIL